MQLIIDIICILLDNLSLEDFCHNTDMHLNRYVIAGSLSIAIHSMIFGVEFEPKAYVIPVGNAPSSVSVHFTSPSAENQKSERARPKTEQNSSTTSQVTDDVKRRLATATSVNKKDSAKLVSKKKVSEQSDKPQQQPDRAVHKPTEEKIDQPQLASSHQGATTKPVLVDKPSFISKPVQPIYPRLARKRGLTGVVTYEVWLDEDGQQVSQQLISSSGQTILDKSALKAIKKWKFSPHSINGQKIAHRVRIPVRFNMD
ncbi:energy transducer TonB [Vibrio tetraodonis]|uniref:energy transducer TonB n=1 Tax=Vibrio tetraodonis TaxID=2231647 RepID=UPI001F07DF5D|nr:energy transducer TonB [Vibrio tetraodonis]